MKDLTKGPWGSYLESIHCCQGIVHMEPLLLQAQTSLLILFVERQAVAGYYLLDKKHPPS